MKTTTSVQSGSELRRAEASPKTTVVGFRRLGGSGRLTGVAISGILITVGVLALSEGLWENTLLGLVMGFFFIDLLLGHRGEGPSLKWLSFWWSLGLFALLLLFIQFSSADLSIIWLLLPLLLLVVLPAVMVIGVMKGPAPRRPLLAALALGGVAAALLRFILGVIALSPGGPGTMMLIVIIEEAGKFAAFLAAWYYTRKEDHGSPLLMALAVGVGFGVQETFIVMLETLLFISGDLWALVFLLRLAPVVMHGLATVLIVAGLLQIQRTPVRGGALALGGVLLHGSWNLVFAGPEPVFFAIGVVVLASLILALRILPENMILDESSDAEE